MTVLHEVLDDVVRRIVKASQPEQIILFGSAARGEMGAQSDLDLLVVKEGPFHQGRLTGDIYMNLIGVGHAVDVLLVTTEDIERFQDTQGLVIREALRDGKIIYERKAVQ